MKLLRKVLNWLRDAKRGFDCTDCGDYVCPACADPEPKTCGHCSEPCGNKWCPTNEEE